MQPLHQMCKFILLPVVQTLILIIRFKMNLRTISKEKKILSIEHTEKRVNLATVRVSVIHAMELKSLKVSAILTDALFAMRKENVRFAKEQGKPRGIDNERS